MILTTNRIFYYWKTKSEELGYDVFLSVLDGELYTHDDLQLFEDMELEHRREMEKVPSFAQLMQDYPTAKTVAKRHIKERVEELQNEIEIAALYGRDTKKMYDEIKKLSFQMAYLTDTQKATKAGLSEIDIQHAKEVPISNFLQVNRDKKIKCIFHADKTASLHIYPTNRFYCFGCNKSGSVVDIVMQLYGLDFLTAVKKIIGK